MQWIKLQTDLFENPKIRLLSAQADGDAMVNLWMRLLCIAGKDGRGVLMLNETKPYSAAMLAVLFGKRESAVARALDRFQEMGMIEIQNGVIILTGWEEHQSTDAMERAREKSCERQRRYRERLREGLAAHGNVTRDASVAAQNGSDKEIEKEKETEKNVVDPENATAVTAESGSANSEKPQDIESAVNCIASAIGLSKTARQELRAFMENGISPALVRRALEMSQDNGAGKWSYMRVILKNLADNGISSIEALNAHEDRFHAGRVASDRKQKAAGSAAPLDYQQHQYTESDFGPDFYYDPKRDFANKDAG